MVAPMLMNDAQPRKEIFLVLKFEEVMEAEHVPPSEGALDREAHGDEGLSRKNRKKLQRWFQGEIPKCTTRRSRLRGTSELL